MVMDLAGPAEENISATVAPLKYGKKWAYTVEIDDQPRDVGLFAPGFFAAYKFTDAPPGVKGGKALPVVGGMAVYLTKMGANETVLDYDDLREIQGKGWGVINHSYLHKGRTYGNPPDPQTPEQMRNDLFWSQAILATETGNGRAPTHFVYPNGYKPYAGHLAEFGLVSGSLVGGSGGKNLAADTTDLKFLNRNYLDEGAWKGGSGKGDPMAGIPEGGPAEGDLIIDFTHLMDLSPDSENQKRWTERLKTLTERFGAEGSDEFWSAPTGEVVNYAQAAKVATVQAGPGSLSVTLSDDKPGSAITVQLQGVPESTQIPVPEGGAVYRDGSTVWVTSPMIGLPGTAGPKVKKIFQGAPEAAISLDKPARIAAVQVRQHGPPCELTVQANLTDGTTRELGRVEPAAGFTSATHLISTVPLTEAPLAQSVEISTNPGFKEVTIWALED